MLFAPFLSPPFVSRIRLDGIMLDSGLLLRVPTREIWPGHVEPLYFARPTGPKSPPPQLVPRTKGKRPRSRSPPPPGKENALGMDHEPIWGTIIREKEKERKHT